MASKSYWRAGSRRFKPKPRPQFQFAKRRAMGCDSRREGDEFVCHCGLRWGLDDQRPACPSKEG